ncbi:MAG: glutamate--tRNA ligase family protein, partial [Pseudomonadota bacterium]
MFQTRPANNYRGRFAPSPSGDLHFGSLVTAMASYADARFNQGDWIIRVDDIDTARVIEGSSDAIINTLEQLGFEWDEQVYYQSENTGIYQQVIDKLYKTKAVYACYCSRKEIQAINPTGRYPG